MISDHEFTLGRDCPTRIIHARENLPRSDRSGGMATWMRAESGKVRALARHAFPTAVRPGASEPIAAEAETRRLIEAGTAVMRGRLSANGLRCEADFLVPQNETLRVYQVVARPFDLEQHRRRLELTGEKGKLRAHWRATLELMQFRLEVIRAIWPQRRVLPFLVVPARGRKSAIEGLHGWFEETLDGWTCTHPEAGAEANRLLVTVGVTEECRAVEADVKRRVASLGDWLASPSAPVLGYSCKKCPFKVVIIDEELATEMAQVTYPLNFLDIETAEAILPPHRGGHIGALHVFQLSVHRRAQAGAALEHSEWLNTEREAPNRRFLAALRTAVGDHGTVLVYSNHERKSLNALLAALLDEGDDDEALGFLRRFLDGPRLVNMHARTSLKWVLPAVWAHADPYAVLKNAGQVCERFSAVLAYLEMQASIGQKRERLIGELQEHCGTDTLELALCWDAFEYELAQRRVASTKPTNEGEPVPPGVGGASNKVTIARACGEGADA